MEVSREVTRDHYKRREWRDWIKLNDLIHLSGLYRGTIEFLELLVKKK